MPQTYFYSELLSLLFFYLYDFHILRGHPKNLGIVQAQLCQQGGSVSLFYGVLIGSIATPVEKSPIDLYCIFTKGLYLTESCYNRRIEADELWGPTSFEVEKHYYPPLQMES